MEYPQYPDLLCIGAQKAATTWLYDLLHLDGRLVLPPIKELHFFSQLHDKDAAEYAAGHRQAQVTENLNWYIENPRKAGTAPDYYMTNLDRARKATVDDFWYARFFEHAGPGRKCIDICPGYFGIPDPGVAHAAALLPQRAKFLLIVRDPVDRAFSQIRMHVSRGLEPSDLSDLGTEARTMWPYLQYSDYQAAVTRWEHYAGAERVHLALFDDIAADPVAALAAIYALIGLEPPPVDAMTHERIFAGTDMAMPAVLRVRLLEALQPQYDFLEPRLPQAVARWRAQHRAALEAG